MKGTSMKKVLATLCSLILAGVMLSACTNSSSGKVRIALIMSHMSNSFTTTLANSAKEQGAAVGVSVTVFDGKKDASNQLNQIENFIASGVDALIVLPQDTATTAQITQKAKAANIPLVYVNRRPSELPKGVPYVGSDSLVAGQLEMEQLAKLSNHQGNVAILQGDPTQEAAQQRTQGCKEVAAKYNMNVVFDQTGLWMRDKGLALAENLIATMLDLECASSNDQTFTHSDLRRVSRSLMQFVPGTDFICSGYSSTPNKDNMFAGSNWDAEDFDDWNIIQRDLRAAGWPEDAPILVVHKASWPGEEKIVRTTLADVKEACRQAKIVSQAMIIASPTIGARQWSTLTKSRLYDASFTHRFRRASEERLVDMAVGKLNPRSETRVPEEQTKTTSSDEASDDNLQ